ncbi:MAG: hypothetical protein IPK73_00340 [Candidatus Obscuribacter sp.]|nr:hypothetical protein [Candidatus Obscuribacter sp.]
MPVQQLCRKRKQVIGALMAALALSTLSVAAVHAEEPFQLKAQNHSEFRPATMSVAYLPPSRSTFPIDLISSLTQSALAMRERQLPAPLKEVGTIEKSKSLAMMAPQAIKNKLLYRPAQTAALAYLPNIGAGAESKGTAKAIGSQLEGERSCSYSGSLAEEQERRARLMREELAEHCELSTLANLLELVQVMGESGSPEIEHPAQTSRPPTVQNSLTKLAQLAGAGQANWAMEKLEKWQSSHNESQKLKDEPLPQPLSSTEELAEAGRVADLAMANDQKSANYRAILGLSTIKPSGLEQSLSAISMVPLIFTKVASLAQTGIEKGNGGGRIKSLADTLFYGQALEIRQTMLTRQAHMLISRRNYAILSGNRLLFDFTELLKRRLSGI